MNAETLKSGASWSLRGYAGMLPVAWTAVTIASLTLGLSQIENGTLEMARTQARSHFAKDVLYRLWNATLGGVYVRQTDALAPNPYLKAADRDIATPSGLPLTLINPAYMTRMVHDLGRKRTGIQGHITSLNPIRPENVADPWESEALRQFERGEAEVSSLEAIDNAANLRLMRPLVTEEACLKCHADQGYVVGSIRGGITTSVPMEPLWAIARPQKRTTVLVHSLFWILGTGGILWEARRKGLRARELRQTEEALRKSEDRLRQLSATSLEGMAIHDRGVLLEANRRYFEMFGYEREELLGKQAIERTIAPESRDLLRSQIRSRSLGPYEATGIRKGGTKFPIEILVNEMEYCGRNVRIASIRDVTKRKEAQEALKASERLHRSAIEALGAVPYYNNKLTDAFDFVGRGFKDLMGYPADQLTPEIFASMFVEGIPAGPMSGMTMAEAKATIRRDREATWQAELRVLTRTGEERWLNDAAKGVYDDQGKLVGTFGILQDITERKYAEAALRASEQSIKEITDVIPCSLYQYQLLPDGTDRFLYVSHRSEQLFGLPTDRIREDASLAWRAIHREDQDAFMESVQKSAESLTRWEHDYRMLAEDGGTEWRHGSAIPESQDDGSIIWTGIVHDITESKRLEEELRKAHNLESLSTLAGGIAHDFNNVLTGVTGNLDLLMLRLDENSEEHKFVVAASKSADRTRDLTRQLMAFAKGGEPVKETASIAELVRETTDLCLSGSNTKPSYLFAEGLAPVDIDRGQIGQVIQNLVLNSDQAMPDGGTLKVSVENVKVFEGGPLPLGAGRYVKMTVEDQGIGMSDDVLARIFDPYYTTKPRGHGLGLAIAHTIISNHGGHISVESEQGVGTTFQIYLPASEKQAGKVADREAEPARGTGRILLMDDEETVHRTVGRMLEGLGYKVESVHDGEEALQAYKAAMEAGEPYDLVIWI